MNREPSFPEPSESSDIVEINVAELEESLQFESEVYNGMPAVQAEREAPQPDVHEELAPDERPLCPLCGDHDCTVHNTR
ncbi:hypothetical protein [Salinadaptatus halalkaliphilus]|uniref:hypothetical protein n=1 Tax=Salinadaptatus halalkaliphilus TaxID=2419781 RepID=UPI0011428079|nr:hypothetical protein [Salinadaptatus halalkaliphilus]